MPRSLWGGRTNLRERSGCKYMYLDTSDERVLAGEFGETPQKMMEILVALGDRKSVV